MNQKFLKQFQYQPGRHRARSFVSRCYYAFKNRFAVQPTIFLNRNPAYSAWEIGDYTYGSLSGSPHIVHYGEHARLRIGRFCSIADKVEIFLGGNHRTEWVTTYPFSVIFEKAAHIKGHPHSAGDINIGHDVWIGQGAAILSGVNIGNGAVIAAHSMVTADIPAYGIVAGNPAKLIKKRFDDNTIAALEQIAWWNWDIEKILDNAELMLQENMQQFIAVHTTHKSN